MHRSSHRLVRAVRHPLRRLDMAGIVLLAALAPAIGIADTACLDSAHAMDWSCAFEVREEYYAALALCRNAEPADQAECFANANSDRIEATEECGEVFEARSELCVALGEDRYDPDLDPADFETEFTNLNPYFPLAPGNLWVIEAEDETITIQVLDQTKLIEGIRCIVVNDFVEAEDESEDTDDWFAQATNGDVHYCGEESKDFEVFEGDEPQIPELVSIDGSFKAGRDGAESGILMFGDPQIGALYRQEYALGEAEDIGEILSIDYDYGDDPELDAFVPQGLADLMCNDDCLVVRDSTPLEPGEFEHKYFSPGIGLFLEVKPEEGETAQLVECNLGGACDLLP